MLADNPSSCANGATVKSLLEFKLDYKPDYPEYSSFYINIDKKVIFVRDSYEGNRVYSKQESD